MKFLKLFALTLILSVAALSAANAAKNRNRACYSVDSRRGWQYLNLYAPYSRVVGVEGSWTVDSVSQSRVGAQGYTGEVAPVVDAAAAEQAAPKPYDTNLPYGALLIGVPGKSHGLLDALQLEQPVALIAMRINEGDSALTNNSGSLEVCFGN